jgi:hypothetical protein
MGVCGTCVVCERVVVGVVCVCEVRLCMARVRAV